MKKLLCLVACLLSFNAAAKCNQAEADKGNTPAMTDCADDSYQKADAKLNKLYKNIVKKISPTQLAEFKTAQNFWIKFKESECNFQSGVNEEGHGSIANMIYIMCEESLTLERVKALEYYTKCQEGDLSCPMH